MKNEFWFRLAKTVAINIIGVVILFKTIAYATLHEYNELSLLGWMALFILAAIGLNFVRKDYAKPTNEELAEVAIGGFIYALKRKTNEIEKNESAEQILNDTSVGEVIKKYMNEGE